MAVETETDREILLADFGQGFTSGALSFTGIFDKEFIGSGEGNVQIETSMPMVLCRSSDVSTIVHDATVTTEGQDYRVRGIEPDGTGFTFLVLEEI